MSDYRPHADHPFRDHKAARVPQALREAPLHSPCPRCYTDCVERKRTAASVFFLCQCRYPFKNPIKAARSHTTWLFTRGRVNNTQPEGIKP